MAQKSAKSHPVLTFPGSKARLSDWICGYIPEHHVYLEPFFGGGAVFFAKKPSDIETINDLDGNVVNFFRVVREKPDELIRALSLTPYSREEYQNAFIYSTGDSDVEWARKFAVRCQMGIGSNLLYRNGFRSNKKERGPCAAKQWSEYPELLTAAALRLKNAQIENLPAAELIRRYHNSDVFIYADPPYLKDVRKQFIYRYEMSDDEHEELLNLLKAHPGKVLISGYDSDMYNDILKGWKKAQKRNQANSGVIRTEVLWMNYDSVQQTLWYGNQPGD